MSAGDIADVLLEELRSQFIERQGTFGEFVRLSGVFGGGSRGLGGDADIRGVEGEVRG